MHVVSRVPRRQVVHGKRMYSPVQRGLVGKDMGLGELDGMFNIGKMFTRMFTFTPSSFKFKNIAGAIGSAVTTIGTGGMANIASEFAGPSGLKLTKGTITGAHSKPMQYVGYGTMAAAAAAGLYFGGSALLPVLKGAGGVAVTGTGLASGTATGTASSVAGASGMYGIGGTAATAATTGGGFLSTVGSGLSTIGSGLMTGLKAVASVLPVMGAFTGGGGQPQMQQQQSGMTQAEYDAYMLAQQQQQQQEAYEAQVRAQQAQMYTPAGYGTPSMAYAQAQPVSMQNAYGDLRSPYTAMTEEGQQVQVDPATGQVIQPGMFPGISTEVMIGGGAIVLLLGWYVMSGNEKTN